MNIRDQREGVDNTNYKQALDHDKTPSNYSRFWSGNYKNPRIVRVSKLFGGKDRHSKVTTVRGLKDRRVRLSVPTAIQLYDLQDRLGLGQPSKVVDWLLSQAQPEIDKLPPLQFPQGGNFVNMIAPPSHNTVKYCTASAACSLALSTSASGNDQEREADDHQDYSISRLLINNGFPYYQWDLSTNLDKNAHPEAELSGNISTSNSYLAMPLMPGSNHLQFYSPGNNNVFQTAATPNMDLQSMQLIAPSSSSSMRFLQTNLAKHYNSECQNNGD